MNGKMPWRKDVKNFEKRDFVVGQFCSFPSQNLQEATANCFHLFSYNL